MSTVFVLALTYSLLLFGLTTWVLLGWGSAVTRLFGMHLPYAEAIFSRLWLGLAVVLLLLQLINYFAPLNWKQVQWSKPRLHRTLAFVVVNLAIMATCALHWRQAIEVAPGFAPLPTPDIVWQRLPRRLIIWTPSDGESCWNARLPCSPYVNPQLRRRGGEIQQGFRVLSRFPDLLTNQGTLKVEWRQADSEPAPQAGIAASGTLGH